MIYYYATPEDVKPSFGAWSNRIEWCEKNCKGNWKYAGKGEFRFTDEKDYTWFLLKWG